MTMREMEKQVKAHVAYEKENLKNCQTRLDTYLLILDYFADSVQKSNVGKERKLCQKI